VRRAGSFVAFLVAALGCFVIKRRPWRPRVHKRLEPPARPVPIICATCAGDRVWPVVTFLDRGRCHSCGGRHYIPAASRRPVAVGAPDDDGGELRFDVALAAVPFDA
jgi:hypothetical protein